MMLSICCDAPQAKHPESGICSRCKNFAEFYDDEEEMEEDEPLVREADALGALWETIGDFKRVLGGNIKEGKQ